MKHLILTTLLLVPVTAVLLSGCTYKTPAVEQPAPVDDADIPKTFFVNTEVHAKTGKTNNVPKKFLCGWASETETGAAAEFFYTNNAIVPDHCNIVFEITENKLIGKLINPSFPDDPSRWQVALTIPISSHYYLEREKDGSGRETNKMVRNSTRSHWSARTHMQLDLDGINLEAGVYRSWESYWGMGGGNITSEKAEWDFQNGFLGVTISKAVGDGGYAKLRFNLKEFKTNPNFKSTPFNDNNYKKMNVLHIIGEKAQGVYPILRGAHWDVSKKIELKTWGVPEKYKPLVQEVVNDWNEALRQAKATTLTEGPFVISDKPAQHAFDLRYPTLVWVSDTKVSEYSPLGIGMALADVTNGEIKWGMVTIYSGYIESYMKRGLDTTGSSSSVAQKLASSVAEFLKIQTNIDIPESIRALGYKTSLPQNISESLAQYFKSPQSDFENPNKADKDKAKANKSPVLTAEDINNQLKHRTVELQKNLQDILAQGAATAQRSSNLAKAQTNKLGLSGLLGTKLFKDAKSQAKPQQQKNQRNSEGLTEQERIENEMRKKYSGPVSCFDRTFADLSPIMDQNGKNSPSGDEAILRNVLKELLSHEFGHFLGLGHQFKENILPAKGTVPDSIYNKLAAKATEEHGYTNYTSVMGYRALNTELKETSDLKPGPQDLLVLRFLYAQEYATYKKGDADFTFFPVPQDGIIPEENREKPEYKTSYFPQCNDWQASLSIDPFCNRFDTGPDAVRIVENYFKEINATLIQHLYAFTDARGGNADLIEMGMWWKSFITLGRVRVFYDYMRKFYKDDFDKFRNDEDAIMQFSEACQATNVDDIKKTVLSDLFKEKPEIKDLCHASVIALNEMEKFLALNAVDFTKRNPRNQFLPGGMNGGDAERDFSRWMGTWEEMSAFPLKYVSLYALTSSSPWLIWGGIEPHFFYDENDGYSYMYLFPREYTKIMATNIKKNLKFASLGQSERTNMGRSVLAMSWLNFQAAYGSNDSSYFPLHLVSKVRSQQEFNLGLVAVILSGKVREGGSALHTVRWDGQVYDMATDKLTPLNSAYILPGGKVIASSPQMFIYPITQFTPFSAYDGYFFAYKIDYVRDANDSLSDISVKNDLKDYYTRLYDACVFGTNGAENGLAGFFSVDEPEFEGFLMGKSLERNEEKLKDFRESIDIAFKKYYEKRPSAKPETCQESLRGLGLIITSAAALNGYWLPEIFDYIQK